VHILRISNNRLGHTIHVYLELSSTQDKAKEISWINSNEGVVVCAKIQTKGRGRGDKLWVSEPGGLYFSVIYYPQTPIIVVADFTKQLANYLKKAIENVATPIYPINLEIRAINDLYLNGKKLAGIIVETESFGMLSTSGQNYSNAYIIGIGVNIHQDKFPLELKDTATSLWLGTGHRFSRFITMKKICQELSRNLF
jgi:BirA family biotin operon repressor/biotin-[acetyl-CoA-carboxylase] ligase